MKIEVILQTYKSYSKLFRRHFFFKELLSKLVIPDRVVSFYLTLFTKPR